MGIRIRGNITRLLRIEGRSMDSTHLLSIHSRWGKMASSTSRPPLTNGRMGVVDQSRLVPGTDLHKLMHYYHHKEVDQQPLFKTEAEPDTKFSS